MPYLLGIDVSEFQGDPDWHKVKASGVTFAIARVAYGASRVDTSYAYNKLAIPNAGIIPGSYHFLTAGYEAAQADLFCSVADAHSIHCLDVEYAGLDVSSWVARYRTHYPHKLLLIYTGRDLWSHASGGNGAQYGMLWLAGSSPNAYTPGSGSLDSLWSATHTHGISGYMFGGWTGWKFCQFTDRASIPGITGYVDGDVFSGTMSDLQALTAISPLVVPKNSGDNMVIIPTPSNGYQLVWPNGNKIATAPIDNAMAQALINAGFAHTDTIGAAAVTYLATVVASNPAEYDIPIDIQSLSTALITALTTALAGTLGTTIASDVLVTAVETGVRDVLHGA